MLNRLAGVFRCFGDHELKYVVIGGVAVVLHGVPRVTFDLDILIEATPENARRLLAALTAAALATAEMTTVDAVLANEISIFRDRIRVDVQTSTPGLEFAQAWANRESIEHAGVRIELASLTDLVASKQAAGRAVDLEDVRLLREAALEDRG